MKSSLFLDTLGLKLRVAVAERWGEGCAPAVQQVLAVGALCSASPLIHWARGSKVH